MAPERIHINDEQLVMIFASSCIEWAAESLDCDYLEVFSRMDKVGLIDDYIIKCYDVLHLESRKNITDDIIQTLLLWEKRQNNKETE